MTPEEIFCQECEYDLTPEEIKNANEHPVLGKEAWSDGTDYICVTCYKNGHDDWVNESMQPIDSEYE